MTEAGPTQMIITPKRQWFATAAYAALLAVVSLLPSGASAPLQWDAALTPNIQNVSHVPAYAILAVLATAAWLKGRPAGVAAMTICGAVCAAYGAALELAQALVPGRTASLADGVSNLAGVIVGVLAIAGWRRLRLHRAAGGREGSPSLGPTGYKAL